MSDFWATKGHGYWRYAEGLAEDSGEYAACATVQRWLDENMRGRWWVVFDRNLGKPRARRALSYASGGYVKGEAGVPRILDGCCH